MSNTATRACAVERPDGFGDERAEPEVWWLEALLPLHAAIWTLAAWLSHGNLDTQGDMVENYVWGIEWQAGYSKHPPLFGWITAAWFSVFPHTDLAYFALSAANAMTGLVGIAALAGRFLPRQLAMMAAFAMAVSPLYSNLAIKFNANAVLLSIWPWAGYFFVRYMQMGGRRSAIALGVLAAGAVLGKYFSIVLLLALFSTALARPVWRKRLVQPKTLFVVAAGVLVLEPHVRWLVLNEFPTFGYASERTGGTLAAAVGRLAVYTLAQVGYMLPSAVFVLLLVQTKRGAVARLMAVSCVKPSLQPDLWWLALGPMLAVAVLAIASKTQMASVWGMAQWFALMPLWLTVLNRTGVTLAPQRAARVLAVYWTLALAISAAVGYSGARRNSDDAAEPRIELSAAVRALWRERTERELAIVAGSTQEAQSVAFYGKGSLTRYWDELDPSATPWLNLTDLNRQGTLFVCRNDDTSCLASSARISAARPIAIEVSKKAWGIRLPARRYQLFLMTPRFK